MPMDPKELNKILEKHRRWIRGLPGGKMADLDDADLRGADLRYANLEGVLLRHADLEGADLYKANLRDADLYGANLANAKLVHANLMYTNFTCANLRDANLEHANLYYATLTQAKNIDTIRWNIHTEFFQLQCPATGAFVGYKWANDCLVKLEICEDALRSSSTSRKCRCSKAKVLEIVDGYTGEQREYARSDWDSNFVYEVGKISEVKNFDTDRWNECAPGIHFFITKEEARKYADPQVW